MARKLVVALLGLLVAVALVAAVKSPTFDAVLLYIHPAASTHGEKWITPMATPGVATADTVRTWHGSLHGMPYQGVSTLVTGLDTSSTYRLDLTIKVPTDTVQVASYGINWHASTATLDTTACAKCGFYAGSCTGSSGTAAKLNVCVYSDGATGVLVLENRINNAASVNAIWTLTGGKP